MNQLLNWQPGVVDLSLLREQFRFYDLSDSFSRLNSSVRIISHEMSNLPPCRPLPPAPFRLLNFQLRKRTSIKFNCCLLVDIVNIKQKFWLLIYKFLRGSSQISLVQLYPIRTFLKILPTWKVFFALKQKKKVEWKFHKSNNPVK